MTYSKRTRKGVFTSLTNPTLTSLIRSLILRISSLREYAVNLRKYYLISNTLRLYLKGITRLVKTSREY